MITAADYIWPPCAHNYCNVVHQRLGHTTGSPEQAEDGQAQGQCRMLFGAPRRVNTASMHAILSNALCARQVPPREHGPVPAAQAGGHAPAARGPAGADRAGLQRGGAGPLLYRHLPSAGNLLSSLLTGVPLP